MGAGVRTARFSERRRRSLGDSSEPFTGILIDPAGNEREVVCSTFPIDIAGGQHGVTIFRDVTDARGAGRTAVAMAQAAAQLVGSETGHEVLAGIARHAVEGTRALACGIAVVGEDHRLSVAGGYSRARGLVPMSGETTARWEALLGPTGEEVVEAASGGRIVVGAPPGPPVVLPDARPTWEADPVMKAFAAGLGFMDWQAGVNVPLSWEGRVFGLFGIYLPRNRGENGCVDRLITRDSCAPV